MKKTIVDILEAELKCHPGVQTGLCPVCKHFGQDCVAHDLRKMLHSIVTRLKSREEWKKSNQWADPHSSSYSNGYDAAVDAEIEFLKGIG